jgi:hypothetical protein
VRHTEKVILPPTGSDDQPTFQELVEKELAKESQNIPPSGPPITSDGQASHTPVTPQNDQPTTTQPTEPQDDPAALPTEPPAGN